jgi:hypothetical protein
LLVQDHVPEVAEPGFPADVQGLLRLAPHRVEWIVPQEKACERSVHTVASEGQITRLDRGAKSRPHEIDRGRDWLRPESNYSHRVVDLRLICDEAPASRPGRRQAWRNDNPHRNMELDLQVVDGGLVDFRSSALQ